MNNDQIKRAVISESGKDDTARPVQQIEFFGRGSDAEIVFPYGVHANLPENSLLVLFPILGQSSNQVAMGGLPDERIPVESGEVVFFHPLTKAKIHFKANGDIDIESPGTINVNAATTEWTGDINVTGNITASETITGTTDVVGGGISLKDHVHNQPLPLPAGTGTYVANTTTGVITGDSGKPKP